MALQRSQRYQLSSRQFGHRYEDVVADEEDVEWLRIQLGHYSAAYTLSTYSHLLKGARDMSFAEFEA